MHSKHKDVTYYQKDQRHEVAPAVDNVVKSDQVKAEIPIFFRYTRMNNFIKQMPSLLKQKFLRT
jgi:hypothetical protein